MFLILLNKYKVQIVVVVLLATGVYAGYRLYSPDPPVIQAYHPAEVLPSGAVVAEVKPDANATSTVPLRKGDTLTRKISASIRAKLPTVDVSGSVVIEQKVEQLATMVKQSAPPEMVEQAKQEVIATCVQRECPAVTVNVDLVRQEDGQQRAVVSSPDGTILAALDVPKENVAPAKELKHAIGITGSSERRAGIWYDFDKGPFRFGVQVNNAKDGSFAIKDGFEGWGRVGVRF